MLLLILLLLAQSNGIFMGLDVHRDGTGRNISQKEAHNGSKRFFKREKEEEEK